MDEEAASTWSLWNFKSERKLQDVAFNDILVIHKILSGPTLHFTVSRLFGVFCLRDHKCIYCTDTSHCIYEVCYQSICKELLDLHQTWRSLTVHVPCVLSVSCRYIPGGRSWVTRNYLIQCWFFANKSILLYMSRSI